MSDDNPFEYPFKRKPSPVNPAVARRYKVKDAAYDAAYDVVGDALERINAADIRAVLPDATDDEVETTLRRIRTCLVEL